MATESTEEHRNNSHGLWIACLEKPAVVSQDRAFLYGRFHPGAPRRWDGLYWL